MGVELLLRVQAGKWKPKAVLTALYLGSLCWAGVRLPLFVFTRLPSQVTAVSGSTVPLQGERSAAGVAVPPGAGPGSSGLCPCPGMV